MILKKSLFAVLCGFFLSVHANAVLVDAVSVIVDNEPITIYEIFRLSKKYNISSDEALDVLIREKLELSQIKQMNIQVDDFALNRQVEAIAAKNSLSVQEFYRLLLTEGVSADAYRLELRQSMQREKLYQYILSSKYQNIEEEQLLAYYKNNPEEFRRFESFDVIKFESAEVEALANVSVNMNMNISNESVQDNASINISNETTQSNDGINVTSETILGAGENPALISVLSKIKIGDETPVAQAGSVFIKYIVTAKNGENIVPFEQVKNQILAKLSSKQESAILKEYFETIKARASITIIRLP
ncbi:MAG: hypothetical protein LBP40_06640 [Campylobacteraceae bacterium]|nr:hypothetical protein [Campylobacteraceae bacterium]